MKTIQLAFISVYPLHLWQFLIFILVLRAWKTWLIRR
jgi:hypothetical protein